MASRPVWRARSADAVHDGLCRAFDGQPLARGNRSLAVEWPAQRVDNASDQPVAHRHVHHPTGTLDLVTSPQVLAFAEQHDADFVRIDVERDAVQTAGELHQFLEAHAGKTGDFGDADGDARDRAHLARDVNWGVVFPTSG